MISPKGTGHGGRRPGAGIKPGTKKKKLKPPAETVLFSLRYSAADTAQLKRAWQYDAPDTDFKEWLKAISKHAPLERAAFIIGFYDENDDDIPIVEQ
jgi:hypothetical protein